VSTESSAHLLKSARRQSRPAHGPGDPSNHTRTVACRRAGTAGIIAVATLVAGVLLDTRTDVHTQGALHTFLDDSGPRLFIAWVFLLVSGLAWLGVVVGLRTLLPKGGATDLFVIGAALGQALLWCGASTDTAAAAPNAHALPLAAFNALTEAAHLTTAAGIAVTGLALVGLGRARATSLWPRAFARGTGAVGVILVLGAVIGPLSLPVLVLWMLTASILLLSASRASGRAPRAAEAPAFELDG